MLPTPYIIHRTPYTLRCTPYTIRRTLYAVHHTLYAVHRTLYAVHRTLYAVHRTLYAVHRTLYAALRTPYDTPQPAERRFYVDSNLQYGEIRSPNWPLAYPSSCRFNYRLSKKKNSNNKKNRRILLFLDSLSMPQHGDCNRTSLKIKIAGKGMGGARRDRGGVVEGAVMG